MDEGQAISEYGIMSPDIKQQDDPNQVYSDMLREDKITNIIAQINPETLLTEVEYRLKGFRKNEFTKEWEKINKEGKEISDLLVSNFVSFLGSILNQNTSLSNFSAAEINNIMEVVVEYVQSDLSVNDEKYGIAGDYPEMTRIGLIVCSTVFAVLKRAQNGMEARRIFSSLRVTESLTQQPKKKGLMDAIAFWK